MANVAASVVRAGVLDVALERHGSSTGWPVVLLHGFPYDVRCFDGVVPPLVEAGAQVVVPYLRGFGPTRFSEHSTLRSGQQAALAHDLADLIVTLGLGAPILAGFDWGGRAACVVSALWPDRVAGLVTVSGYNVQDIAAAAHPARPDAERRLWYQYYLHGERGRAGLAAYRAEFARQLWREWSPTWRFSDAEFAATEPSFHNPDFVEVVVHSYRHRFALVPGDPAFERTEERIAAQPVIAVPTVVLDPLHDPMWPTPSRQVHQDHFSALVDYRQVAAGHNVPQECPASFAEAVLRVHAG